MDKQLDIVYEDKDIVVLNKQAGISVHPSVNEPRGTLVDALLARYPEIKDVGDPSTSSGQENIRPGIVHRLDKDTSGLLVVAKNQKAFEFLKKEWQEGLVIKKYLTLVQGRPKEKGKIVSELARSPKDFRRRMVVKPARPNGRSGGPEKQKGKKITGKLAVTEYKVIRRYSAKGGSASGGKDFSLVEVEPKTGRTHQIRVHMASIGHPVAGDKIYGGKNKNPEGLARHFLHAFYLSFSLPDGKKLALEADLPEDLRTFLTKLEK